MDDEPTRACSGGSITVYSPSKCRQLGLQRGDGDGQVQEAAGCGKDAEPARVELVTVVAIGLL